METKISYGCSEDAWAEYDLFLIDLIDRYNIKRVCDIGGGGNPVLNMAYIKEKDIDYSILDISEIELEKAPAGYFKIVADISSPDFSINEKFDLVFSKMLAEHIIDAKQFHRNVLSLLNDDGWAVHFFPTLYSFPFLVNRLTPDRLACNLLNILAPRDRFQHGKFPAYYHWCRGPVQSQIDKFKDLGYDIVEYRGFFGHEGYYKRINILKRLHTIKTNYLLKNPSPFFTSYAYVVLKKARQDVLAYHHSDSQRSNLSGT
jgi:hypothetical protein